MTAYQLAKKPKVQRLTLIYQKVAINFRKEVRKSIKARNPAGHRIGIGSFGPSFTEKYADQEDASNREVGYGSKKGGQGRKRRRDVSPSGRTVKRIERKCPVYGLRHRLARYFVR